MLQALQAPLVDSRAADRFKPQMLASDCWCVMIGFFLFKQLVKLGIQ